MWSPKTISLLSEQNNGWRWHHLSLKRLRKEKKANWDPFKTQASWLTPQPRFHSWVKASEDRYSHHKIHLCNPFCSRCSKHLQKSELMVLDRPEQINWSLKLWLLVAYDVCCSIIRRMFVVWYKWWGEGKKKKKSLVGKLMAPYP